ncbi:MAG: GlsB/YeaQ/YmgE family stress response membrane protein [Butyrivibrio sp.]|nr:GlsB/YeaQ/YmgE family stress response membrane protein [Butyrivibrio sp.]
MLFGLLGSIILGAIAGYIASKIMKENSGTLKNIILGVLGAFVGGAVFGLVGFTATSLIGSLIVSVVGACICIWLGRKLF